MSTAVQVALYGFVPFVAIAFAALRPARAVLVSYVGGWLFLPVAGFEVLGFLDYTKSTAVPLVVFLAVAAFDLGRLSRFRASALDLPIAALCLVPLASSLSNGLGWYDGLSGVAYQTVTWGLPWLIGRLYFSTPEGLRELAVGIFAGGLVYAPLCLWEIRMSPQLHATLYGFHQHDWVQTLRAGGWRPMVFQHHGLMLGLWMTSATVIGIALWTSGALRKLWGIPLYVLVPGLLATTILCKSFGAIALLAVGALALLGMRSLRTSLPMLILVCAPATYVAARASGAWTGASVVEVVRGIDAERANSLSYRIASEERSRAKAAEKPVFGWGGWGRSFVARSSDALRREQVTIDSLWMLVFGKHGWVGLAGLLLAFAVPVVVLWKRRPPRAWAGGGAAFAWSLALVLTLYAIDNVVNAMVNPVYLLAGGGLCGLSPALARAAVRRRAAAAPPSPAAGVPVR